MGNLVSTTGMDSVAPAIKEIQRLQDEAVRAVRDDTIFAGVDERAGPIIFTGVEKTSLRRIVLGAQWRLIDLQIKRCEDAGVKVAGYSEQETWVNRVLKLGGSS